jgi:hypothetical protein
VALVIDVALALGLIFVGRANLVRREPSRTTLVGVALRMITLAVLLCAFIPLLEDRAARL